MIWAALQWKSARWTKKRLEELSAEDQKMAGSDIIRIESGGLVDERHMLLESEQNVPLGRSEKKMVKAGTP